MGGFLNCKIKFSVIFTLSILLIVGLSSFIFAFGICVDDSDCAGQNRCTLNNASIVYYSCEQLTSTGNSRCFGSTISCSPGICTDVGGYARCVSPPAAPNCSAADTNTYNCSVECAKSPQPAACEICCKCSSGGGSIDIHVCNEDYRCDYGETFTYCPSDCVPFANVIAVDNLITGNVISCTNYVKKTCNEIVNVSGACSLCGCGVHPVICNNNGVCEPGEEISGTCSDCGCDDDGICEEITRGENGFNCPGDCGACEVRNQAACGQLSHCSWCPWPSVSIYPYDYSSRYSSQNGDVTGVCVDTRDDPFNCGGCGFTPDGTGVTSSFCAGSDTPFCINSTCLGRDRVSCRDIENLIDNPFYYYYTEAIPHEDISTGATAYYSYYSELCQGNITNEITPPSSYDQNNIACEAVAGAGAVFSSTLGCCGNNKCRVDSGSMCQATSLCDGTSWHTSSNSLGEVFKAACSPYPIANINGEFIKCIDNDKYDNYTILAAAAIEHGGAACLPGSNDNQNIDFNLAGKLDYACSPNTYSYGAIGVNAASRCEIQAIDSYAISRGGELLCLGPGDNSDIYGFAAFFNRTVFAWNVSGTTYATCPAMPTQWYFNYPTSARRLEPYLVVPCPGKVDFSLNEINASRIALYGGTDTRYALFCGNQRPTTQESLLTLDYIRGDGRRMGRVNGQDYMCYTSTSGTPGNRARIAVCCGSQACNVPGTVAELLTQGQTITLNGDLWTCQADGSWSSNLDYEYAQSTCTSAGHFATGTYCCSEPDDNQSSIWIKESYNQVNGPGGCFKGTRQTNNRVLSYNGVSYPNVYVANGSFYGCGFGAFTPEFDQGNQNLCQPDANGRLSSACLHSIENWPDPGSDFSASSSHRTRSPLVNRASYCSGFSTPSSLTSGIYCAYNNTWSQTSLTGTTRESTIPADLLAYFRDRYNVPSLTASGCCNTTTCWGPTGCHPEQLSPTERFDLGGNVFYKCLQGNWVRSDSLKTTPDGCESGVCPLANQCVYRFVNVTPSYLGCINNREYVNDFLCDNGKWSSRTKMLALTLANLTQNTNRFVLMCGPPKDTLVNWNTSQSIGNSNNFCVLNLNGQRIIGTTLNQEFYNASSINTFVNSLMWSFNNIYQYMADDVYYPASFDFTCNEGATNFVQCMGAGSSGYLRLYYDKTYQMVIFSNRNVNGLMPSFGDTICSVLPRWLQWLCPNPPPLTTDLQGVKLFNKVYAARNGTKQVFGVSEPLCLTDVYSFNYTGYLQEELMPLILYPDEGVFKNFTSESTIFISKSRNDPWDPWASLTILRTLEHP